MGPAPNTDLVKIRSYQPSDEKACQQMFSTGMQSIIGSAAALVFSNYFNHAAILGVVAIFAGMKCSYWCLAVYVLGCVLFFAMLYILVYIGFWVFINECLTSDLSNIEKSYMSSKGSHMFVAEWNAEVVGMVGIMERGAGKDRFGELQRMSVSTKYHRLGIAKKLVQRVVQSAKEDKYSKIILRTSTAQPPAIKLYTHCNFQHTDTIHRFPRVLLGLCLWQFELQLE